METEIITEAIKAVIEPIANHVAILNDEVGQLEIDMAVVKSQLAELMWWFRAIAIVFVVAIGNRVWKVMVTYKNNRLGEK